MKIKKLLTILVTLFFSTVLFSQKYPDLLILKANTNWEQLIKEADKYTLKEDTEKDPEPYYYLAYGLYKISFVANRDEKFKNAYKESLTAISKMLRYDESGQVQEEHQEFVTELKLSLLELIMNDVGNEQYNRAFGWVMKLYKFGRGYIPVYFFEGALRYRRGDPSTARRKWEVGVALMKPDTEELFNTTAKRIRERLGDELNDVDNWGDADKEIMKIALYQSALVLKENLQEDEAVKFMNIGDEYFKDDDEWRRKYEDITQ